MKRKEILATLRRKFQILTLLQFRLVTLLYIEIFCLLKTIEK